MKFNGKNLTVCYPNNSTYSHSNVLWNSYIPTKISRYYSFDSVVPYDRQSLETNFKNKYTTIDNTITKLYFSPSTSFPRFKIKDTEFKRTIKVDKADCVVIPEVKYIETEGTFEIYKDVLDDGTEIYRAICQSYFEKNLGFKGQEWYNRTTGNTLVEKLKNSNILTKNATLVYTGTPVCCASNLTDAIEGIMSNYPKVILDTELDKYLNKSLAPIDEETIISLNDMLSSPDAASVELGIKILQTLDVTSNPMSVIMLIGLNHTRIASNKAKTTVGFKQVLDTLEINNFYFGTDPIMNARGILQKLYNKSSEEDVKLALKLVKPHFERVLQAFKDKLLKGFELYGINIKTSVE